MDMKVRTLEESALAAVNYIKLHHISLIQDLEDARNNIPIPEDEYFESDSYYMGAIDTCEHLMSVVTGILINSTTEKE
jgi:hypothetical protein